MDVAAKSTLIIDDPTTADEESDSDDDDELVGFGRKSVCSIIGSHVYGLIPHDIKLEQMSY